MILSNPQPMECLKSKRIFQYARYERVMGVNHHDDHDMKTFLLRRNDKALEI